MNPSELYKLWAPEDSIWSNWAKPVLFTDKTFVGGEPPQTTQWQSSNVAWAPAPESGTAVVLDLPGADAVWYGMALSQCGYRPVPLYNGVRGPALGGFELVNVDAIVVALHEVGETLAKLQLPANAPPAFLIDENRFAGGSFANPGRFDNRWWIFPQDFPSANYLLAHGIRSVVLGQNRAVGPQRDLAHVLLRWQDAGNPDSLLRGRRPGTADALTSATAGQVPGLVVSSSCACRFAPEQRRWFWCRCSRTQFRRRIRLKGQSHHP